ncbi:unnamed protein product [Zymoseptoria tritici ST99CH_1A5]|uniref:Uncharacterized protein n=1 Tax=Zymoseptoria tritici ST99CH_1A5 TaxID=1276529 RepID=A0A1Y6LF33_ZYMTR|nr:unnamed protein product [Zymoseptoria tritici ST99CH_1A5]
MTDGCSTDEIAEAIRRSVEDTVPHRINEHTPALASQVEGPNTLLDALREVQDLLPPELVGSAADRCPTRLKGQLRDLAESQALLAKQRTEFEEEMARRRADVEEETRLLREERALVALTQKTILEKTSPAARDGTPLSPPITNSTPIQPPALPIQRPATPPPAASRQHRIFATPLAVRTLHQASRSQPKTVRRNLNDFPLPPLEIIPQKRGQAGNLPSSKLQRVVPGQEHADGTRSAGLHDLPRVFSPGYLPARDTMIRKSRPGYRTPKSAMQSRYLGGNSIVRPEFANEDSGQDSPGNIEPHTPLLSEKPGSSRLSLHGARTEPPRLRSANPGPRRSFRNRSHVSDSQPSSDIAIPDAIAPPLSSPRGPPLFNPAPPSALALGIPLRPSSEARSDASGSVSQHTELARLPHRGDVR